MATLTQPKVEQKTLVRYRVETGLGILELDDPPANTYTYEMMRQLDEAILQARFDDNVHVIVLRGHGDKFFSAGANIAYLNSITPRYKYFFCLHANETLNRLEHTPKLTIAALNGHTVGGGLEIAMACDLRLAKESQNKIGLPEVNLGVLPGTGGTQRLARIVGKPRAIEMMVKGETFSFDRAKEIGLVHEVFPAEGFWEQVVLYAKQFCPPNKASKAVGLINRAVQAARTCFDSKDWQGLSPRKRGALLFRLADLLEQRAKDFAELETRNNGKPLFESKIDIAMAVQTYRYYAGWADKLTGDTLPVDGPFFAYTLREPVGVVGAIVPWNFPLNLASWKIAPALAAGCTVVLKPAHETPLTALLLGDLAVEAGLPPGALNVVPGMGTAAGAALVRHPQVDKIAFTGSTEVGQWIMREAAGTLKRVTLELGGKSPNVIFADADLAAAVRGAQTGIFYGKGEVCAAGSRLLVEKAVHDQVVEQLAERAKEPTPGDPFDKNTRPRAIVSKAQQGAVLAYIAAGQKEGARLVAGGKPAKVNGKGYYVEATVFDGAKPGMKIVDEEIFGPVLAVLTFDNEEEGVRLANHSMYGLAAGIWTKDIQKAHRVARAIKAGTVWVNTYNFYEPRAPFGGDKVSGFGRDLGREALDNYTETKRKSVV